MSDFALNQISPRQQTIGLGAFLVAVLIVAALVLTAVKVAGDVRSRDLPSLIEFENPASLSGFTA
ncbi:MAG: hypothetical protein HYU58_08135 [Proteobacteria bacterium]|nr:hypothetical protein [Pseudomonadota bacterium]